MKVILKDIWGLLISTFKKAGDDEIFTFGAAIAFYTIFSIAPLLVLVVSMGGLFLSEEVIIDQIQFIAGDFLDDTTIQNMSEYFSESAEGGTGIFTTIIAVIAIAFGATTVISQLKIALDRIWNVREVKMKSVWKFLLNRLLSFGMILLISFLLILSLITEAVLGVVGSIFMENLPDFKIDFFIYLNQAGTLAFAVLAFTLIFKILPDVHARWIDVIVGACVTTLLFLLGKYLIGFYFSTAGIDATYRAAGSLIIFVIWVYYNVLIILLGAVFTQVYTERFGGKILPYKFVTLDGIPTIEHRE